VADLKIGVLGEMNRNSANDSEREAFSASRESAFLKGYSRPVSRGTRRSKLHHRGSAPSSGGSSYARRLSRKNEPPAFPIWNSMPGGRAHNHLQYPPKFI
jgi:hypothetical protein